MLEEGKGGVGGDQGLTARGSHSNAAGSNEEEDTQGGYNRQAGSAFCGCSRAVVHCSVVNEEEEQTVW